MRKPGYKTSEFWFTLVSFIFSGLYLVGLLNDNSQKEELISNVSHAVESCILIGGQFAILYKYIMSRKQTKIEYEKTKQLELEENKKNSEPVSIGEIKDEQQRTDNTRSRKTNNKSKKQSTKRKTSSNKRSVENSPGSNSKRNTNNRKTRE